MNLIKIIAKLFRSWKTNRDFKKRLKELQKRDPFIY